jgi:hypothetical protein
MMPTRNRTRTENRYRIASERHINAARIAQQHRLEQARIIANDEPPPF